MKRAFTSQHSSPSSKCLMEMMSRVATSIAASGMEALSTGSLHTFSSTILATSFRAASRPSSRSSMDLVSIIFKIITYNSVNKIFVVYTKNLFHNSNYRPNNLAIKKKKVFL